MIWQAKVAPRIKYLCWRIVQDILPVRVKLKRRGLDVQSECCVCGLVEESLQHALFECVCSNEAWKLICPEMLRNISYHEGGCLRLEAIAMAATRQCTEFAAEVFTDVTGREAPDLTWQPPTGNKTKLNVDASYLSASKTVQLGAVARNSSGIIKYCATKVVSGVVTPLQAELLAIRFGLEIASRMGEEDIAAENDSKLAVDEIIKGDSSMCAWGSILTYINYCSRSFNSCSFAFVVRIMNRLAHNLTGIPCRTEQVQVWKDTFM
ncbi:hypothetical protein DITRI_Ditri03aG0003900 [Diplodiscus trichospermus]